VDTNLKKSCPARVTQLSIASIDIIFGMTMTLFQSPSNEIVRAVITVLELDRQKH
jgi:hypothetical protein